MVKVGFDHEKDSEDADQLYDLRVDLGENINLADNAEYSDILIEMKQLLKTWLKDMPGPYWEFTK